MAPGVGGPAPARVWARRGLGLGRRWFHRRQVTQPAPGSTAHPLAVVVGGQLLQGQPRGQRSPGVVSFEQLPERLYDGLPLPGEQADSVSSSGGEVGRRGHRGAAPGDVHVALDVEGPLGRCLVGVGAGHLVVDVAVELVERDPAVEVSVGLAGAEALHQGAREEGRLGSIRTTLLHGSVLEGELQRRRRGDHGPAASAQAIIDVDGAAGARGHSPREGSGVAAVEQEQDPPGARAFHHPVDRGRRDRGGLEQVEAGVGGGEVQLAAVVLEAVDEELPAPGRPDVGR